MIILKPRSNPVPGRTENLTDAGIMESPMNKFISLPVLSMTLVFTLAPFAEAQRRDDYYRPPPANGPYGSGPGDVRPRAPKIEEEKEPVTTPLDEQWKWMLAGIVVVFVVYTVWHLLRESAKVRPPEKRQPWEIE
jgi:hypothetical protein